MSDTPVLRVENDKTVMSGTGSGASGSLIRCCYFYGFYDEDVPTSLTPPAYQKQTIPLTKVQFQAGASVVQHSTKRALEIVTPGIYNFMAEVDAYEMQGSSTEQAWIGLVPKAYEGLGGGGQDGNPLVTPDDCAIIVGAHRQVIPENDTNYYYGQTQIQVHGSYVCAAGDLVVLRYEHSSSGGRTIAYSSWLQAERVAAGGTQDFNGVNFDCSFGGST